MAIALTQLSEKYRRDLEAAAEEASALAGRRIDPTALLDLRSLSVIAAGTMGFFIEEAVKAGLGDLPKTLRIYGGMLGGNTPVAVVTRKLRSRVASETEELAQCAVGSDEYGRAVQICDICRRAADALDMLSEVP